MFKLAPEDYQHRLLRLVDPPPFSVEELIGLPLKSGFKECDWARPHECRGIRKQANTDKYSRAQEEARAQPILHTLLLEDRRATYPMTNLT